MMPFCCYVRMLKAACTAYNHTMPTLMVMLRASLHSLDLWLNQRLRESSRFSRWVQMKNLAMAYFITHVVLQLANTIDFNF